MLSAGVLRPGEAGGVLRRKACSPDEMTALLHHRLGGGEAAGSDLVGAALRGAAPRALQVAAHAERNADRVAAAIPQADVFRSLLGADAFHRPDGALLLRQRLRRRQ